MRCDIVNHKESSFLILLSVIINLMVNLWNGLGVHAIDQQTLDLLENPATTVETLLQLDSVIDKYSAENSKEVSAFFTPQNISKLIYYVTTMPNVNSPEQEKYRFPFVSSEILSNKNLDLIKVLNAKYPEQAYQSVISPEKQAPPGEEQYWLLKDLFKATLYPETIYPTIGGYISSVVKCLLSISNSDQGINEFLEMYPEYLTGIVKYHMANISISTILEHIIGVASDADYQPAWPNAPVNMGQQNTKQAFLKEQFRQKLIFIVIGILNSTDIDAIYNSYSVIMSLLNSAQPNDFTLLANQILANVVKIAAHDTESLMKSEANQMRYKACLEIINKILSLDIKKDDLEIYKDIPLLSQTLCAVRHFTSENSLTLKQIRICHVELLNSLLVSNNDDVLNLLSETKIYSSVIDCFTKYPNWSILLSTIMEGINAATKLQSISKQQILRIIFTDTSIMTYITKSPQISIYQFELLSLVDKEVCSKLPEIREQFDELSQDIKESYQELCALASIHTGDGKAHTIPLRRQKNIDNLLEHIYVDYDYHETTACLKFDSTNSPMPCADCIYLIPNTFM